MKTLRVLLIEDCENDQALIIYLLERAGFTMEFFKRVETASDMLLAVTTEVWDAIICDYKLPQFDAPDALRIVRQSGLDIPFIVVSGAVGEEVAVEMMKLGAHDYVMKSNLTRLPLALEREVREAALRSEQKKVESSLRAAYADLAAIYASSPNILFMVDDKLRAGRVNDMAVQLANGVRKQHSETRRDSSVPCLDALAKSSGCGSDNSCNNCSIRVSVLDTLRTGTIHGCFEAWIPPSAAGAGESRCLLVSCSPVQLESSRKVLVSAQDITQQKQAEEALRKTVSKLQAALTEKTILLSEVHHRVKNNLAIVCSLLSLKANSCESEEVRSVLEETQQRIRTIASIHEHLYGNTRLDHINAAQYIPQLVSQVYEASASRSKPVTINLDVAPMELPLGQAVPCALILNELLLNTLKHAFPGNRTGMIHISFRQCIDGQMELVVEDDGVGSPVDLDSAGAKSLGLRIVRILTSQLDGTVEKQPGPGTRMVLRFPGKPDRPLMP